MKPNKRKITLYENMHFNSVVIITLAAPSSFIKSVSCEKVSGRISLSPPKGELRGSKDGYFRNKEMYKNDKVDSL